ncbi:MAG: hypothetical protein ACK5YA_00840 [bacterium]
MAKIILSNLLKDLNNKLENLEQINERQESSILLVKTNLKSISENTTKFNSIVEAKRLQTEKNNIKPVDKHEGRSKSKADLNKTNEGLAKTKTDMSKSHKNLNSNILNKSSTSIAKNNQTLNVSTNKKPIVNTTNTGKSMEKNKSVNKITPIKATSNQSNPSNVKTNITNISAVKKPEKSRNVSKDKKLVASESNKTSSTTKAIPKKETKAPEKKENKLIKKETSNKIPLRQKTPGKINTNSNLKEDNKSTVTTASSKARITTLKENLKPKNESINNNSKVPNLYTSKDVDTKTESGSLSKKGKEKEIEVSVKSSKEELKKEKEVITLIPQPEITKKTEVEAVKTEVINQKVDDTEIKSKVLVEEKVIAKLDTSTLTATNNLPSNTTSNEDANYSYISNATRKVKFINRTLNLTCSRGQTTIFDMLTFSEKNILINSNKTIRKALRQKYKEILLKDVTSNMNEWTTKKFQILDVIKIYLFNCFN